VTGAAVQAPLAGPWLGQPLPAQLLPGGFGALFTFVFASAVVALFVSIAYVWLSGSGETDAEEADPDEEPDEEAEEGVATPLSVIVEDAATGERFPRPVTFVAEPTGVDSQGRGGGNDPTVVDSPTGETELRLPLGEWRVSASDDAGEIDAATVGTLDSQLRLQAAPWQIDLTLRGGDESGPLVSGAAVRAAPDVGDPVTAASDQTGRVSLSVPRSAGETTLVVDADGYETQRRTTTVRADVDGTLALTPRSGSLRVATAVGDRPTSTTVRLEPVSTTHPVDARRLRTGEDGVATVDAVPVGEYRLRAGGEVGSPATGDSEGAGTGAVGTATTTVTVRADERTDTTLSMPFEFEPSDRQRAELDRLRRRVAGLAADAGPTRDGTVPRYFASVLTELLDAIAEAPARGDAFAESGRDPGPAIDALLAAAGDAVGAVESAMAADRCVARFEACADLSGAQVSWEGSYDLRTFLAMADAPETAEDRLADRLAAVQETVDVEADLVADAAPATETIKRVQRRLTSAGRSSVGRAGAGTGAGAEGSSPGTGGVPRGTTDAGAAAGGRSASGAEATTGNEDGRGTGPQTVDSDPDGGGAERTDPDETTPDGEPQSTSTPTSTSASSPTSPSTSTSTSTSASEVDREGQDTAGTANGGRPVEDVTVAARTFAAEGLLEAVEDLFARPDLRRRLEHSTV
jgi:hypothetical protein